MGKRLQSPFKGEMGVGRGGEKAEPDVPFQGGSHAWAQRGPTNEPLKAQKDPTIREFLWVRHSAERPPVAPGELLPGKGPSPEAPVETARGVNDWLTVSLPVPLTVPIKYSYFMNE